MKDELITIKVLQSSRGLLKMIAAMKKEKMFETVDRLATKELLSITKRRQPNKKKFIK